MKKFKSLMLAALASAALAAPSFAGGHGDGLSMSGEIVVGMEYKTSTPDGGDTNTEQDTYIGDVNFKLTGSASESATYAFEFEKDDEGDGSINFEGTGVATSGDNSIKAYGEIQNITGDANDAMGYGDVYIQGGNKTLTVKVGKFGGSENYAGGLGYFRAPTFDAGNLTCTNATTGAPKYCGSLGNIEHILIDPFEGIEVDIVAGDISVEVAVPWMNATASVADGYRLEAADGSGPVETNVSGIRPNIKAALGGVNLSATFYSLTFSPEDSNVDTVDKSDEAFQLMGSVGAGSATVGLGYTSKTTKNGDDELNPSTLNGYVTVGLGSGQQVGASFEVLEDGTEEDEATATRISASYATPFFVEAITLKLGAGTTTQTSDLDAKSGTSSGFEAEWVYNF
jgi:hypothetical protein